MARSRLRPSPGAMWPKGRHPDAPQTLAGAAYAGGVVRQRYGAHRTTRRGVAYVVGLLLVIAGAQVGVAGWWYARAWQERAQFVEAQRLRAALLTFRPSDRAGFAEPATAADLAPERSVRTNPSRCAPLTPARGTAANRWSVLVRDQRLAGPASQTSEKCVPK